MESEFNLSKKMDKWVKPIYRETRDIKEFIKVLKQNISEMIEEHKTDGESKDYCLYGCQNKTKEIIDKLSGDKFNGK